MALGKKGGFRDQVNGQQMIILGSLPSRILCEVYEVGLLCEAHEVGLDIVSPP